MRAAVPGLDLDRKAGSRQAGRGQRMVLYRQADQRPDATHKRPCVGRCTDCRIVLFYSQPSGWGGSGRCVLLSTTLNTLRRTTRGTRVSRVPAAGAKPPIQSAMGRLDRLDRAGAEKRSITSFRLGFKIFSGCVVVPSVGGNAVGSGQVLINIRTAYRKCAPGRGVLGARTRGINPARNVLKRQRLDLVNFASQPREA